MLVYKSIMFRLAAKIAKIYKAKFLVLGDSLGQVASQTAQNISSLYKNSPIPIISPLIGYNKEEILNIARDIGTENISSLPYGDCCSYFLAKHPETLANKIEISNLINLIDNKLEDNAINDAYHCIFYSK